MGASIDGPTRRRVCALALAAGAVASWPIRARAASFPSRTVHLVIGQAAGGQTDTIARMVSIHFASRWGASVVVENVPGAGGLIAGRTVARSIPDGHTLYIGASSNIAWSALQTPNAGYDPHVAWAPIGRIVRLGFVLAVRPDLDVANVREFAVRTRAHPESLTVASQGENSNSGRALRMFEKAIGAKVLEVPYKATVQSVQAVVAGEVDAAFCDLSAALAQRDRLRVLAQTARRRSPLAPDIATFKEQGFPQVALEPWYGLVAPAGTPPDAVAALAVALRAFLTDERVAERFKALGYEIILDTPDEFAAAIRDELHPTGHAAGTTATAPGR
jgi:tripartite-type tricarboxylate transporter receptor subunit TctC